MSLTLGEKLRQAREERGFTISEVAEQTRISSLYLQSIENDDYNNLPGGIFNKGFVKSFAKFVGINEQEALEDYGRLISQNEGGGDGDDLKVFRPEVLTDDRSAASMAPTIIIAAIILALMTIGVLFLVDYLRQPASELAADTQNSNKNTAVEIPSENPREEIESGVPDMGSIKVEFTALSEPVALLVTTDGKTTSTTVSPNTSVLLEPKEALKLSYSKSLASIVQLAINGKKISLPATPMMPRRNAIEIEINKENLARIWQSGSIQFDTSPVSAPDSNAVVSNSVLTAPAQARPISTPIRRSPTTANSNVDTAKPSPRPTDAPKPSPGRPGTATNRETPPDRQ